VEERARVTRTDLPPGHPEQGEGDVWRFMLRFSARGTLLALFWWILSNGNLESWVVGGPVVLSATTLSLMLSPGVRPPWRLSGLISFVPFFIWRSICGSIDVARRALHPKVLLEPAFMDYSLSLPVGAPRLFMANVVSLLPGTLSAELRGDCLKVHILDATVDAHKELQTLESRIANIFTSKPLHRVDSGGRDYD